MRVKVDSNKCFGCGNCVALTESNVFDFNDDGLAQAIASEVPADFEEIVKEAIEQCPTEAISEVVNEEEKEEKEEKEEEEEENK